MLKSPPHTCRIRLLLELFPEARFLHIHRDPFQVYQSTMGLLDRGLKLTRLQTDRGFDWSERTLRVYKEMHDVFFEERSLIPEGQFSEIAFSELEADPIGQLRRAYRELSLPDFTECEPAIRSYAESLGDYRRNQFSTLAPALHANIARRWSRAFEEFGYQA